MIKRSNVKTFRFNETIDFPPREKEKKKIPLRLRLNHGYHRTRKTVGLGWGGEGGFVFGSISFFASSSIEESGRFLALLVTRSI